MTTYRTVFVTERGEFHQQAAMAAAPACLDLNLLRQPDRSTLLAALSQAEFLVSERVGAVDAEMIRAAPRLKLILRLGSMSHDIDLDAARRAGVPVCCWPQAGVIRVAEHLVMQLLALSKKLREVEVLTREASARWGIGKRTDEDTFAYNWTGRSAVEGLWQRRVGIIGFGEIGVELARRLAGWGVDIAYAKRRRLPQSVESELGLTYTEIDTLFSQSDFVVNLLPYFPQTDQILGAELFAKMKERAFFVSCGSGSVIDEAALADALRSGKLAGVALDTFEWEPIRPDNPLIAAANAGHNVLLTPHTAAGAATAAQRERQDDYTNIVRFLEGQPLKYRVG